MRICLFEDHGVIDLEPLALTRPVFDLLCGLSPLSAKQARYFAPCTVGAMVRPFLAELTAERRPDLPVNDPAWLRQGPVVMVNGRWLPPDDSRGIDLTNAGPCVGTVGSEVAFAIVTPDRLAGCSPASLQSFLEHSRSRSVDTTSVPSSVTSPNPSKRSKKKSSSSAQARAMTSSRFPLIESPTRHSVQ